MRNKQATAQMKRKLAFYHAAGTDGGAHECRDRLQIAVTRQFGSNQRTADMQRPSRACRCDAHDPCAHEWLRIGAVQTDP